MVFLELDESADCCQAVNRLGNKDAVKLVIFKLEVFMLFFLFVIFVSFLEAVTDGAEAHLLIINIIHLRICNLVCDFLAGFGHWLGGKLHNRGDVTDELRLAATQ